MPLIWIYFSYLLFYSYLENYKGNTAAGGTSIEIDELIKFRELRTTFSHIKLGKGFALLW